MTAALSLLDMAAFRAQSALVGVVTVQMTWLVAGPPDVGRIEALADRLAASNQLGRVILPAPILGGRDHWGPLPATPQVVVEPNPIERAAWLDWAAARAQVPIDTSSQPWHVAIQPFTDGGHAVTLVASHALTDGVGLVNVLASVGPPAARPYAGRRPGLVTALREAITGSRASVRAAITAARMSPSPRAGGAGPVMTRAGAHTLAALIDASAWHAAVATLGGSSNALFVSVAAQVAAAIGRVTADGTAIIYIPVNTRTEGDDVSANALTSVLLELAADRIRDVAFIRAEIKRALAGRGPEGQSFNAMLPVVPYLPMRAMRVVARASLRGGDPITSASYVGVFPQSLVDAPGPASAVLLSLGLQYRDATEVPERVSAILGETPAGTVALHLGVASDRIGTTADLRAAVRHALLAMGVEPREIL